MKIAKLSKKIIPGLLIAAPVLVALLAVPGMPRSFDFPKLLLLQLILMLVSLITVVFLLKAKKLKINAGFFESPIALTVWGILFVIFLATIFSEQMLNSIWGSYDRGLGLITWVTFGVYFAAALLFLDKSWMKRGVRWMIYGTTLIASYGVCQKLGWDPIFANFNTDIFEGRIFATLGNPDFLAQLFAPVVFLSTFIAWSKKKWLYLLPSGVMFTALLLTESRASLLALIFGAAFMVFLLVKNKKRLITISAATLLIFVIAVQAGVPTLERFQLNAENFRSAESRLVIWDLAARIIADHPVLGVGPDNFEIHFPAYMTPEIYYLEDNLHVSADRAHNELLEMGLIGGFPLMLLYLALIFFVFKAAFTEKDKNKLPVALAVATLIIFAQNQLTFSQITHFLLTFFMLAGLIIYQTKPAEFTWKPNKALRYISAVVMVAFVVFCFDQLFTDRMRAEAWYAYAITTDDTKTGLEYAIHYDPTNTKLRYEMLMWFPEEREYELSVLREIEGDTIEVMAWTANHLLETDTEAAYETFEEVIAINPLYPHTTRAYADGLYTNEEFELAAEYYERYLEISPQFWTWCPDLEEHSEYEQKKYRIFYKNVPDFNNSLIHLYNAYVNLEEEEKAEEVKSYLDCMQ